MIVAIGADHRGFVHKEYIQRELHEAGIHKIEWIDVGAYNEQRSDYPLYAKKVCDAMRAGQAQYGVLICGSGVGMAIAANRYCGIYAAVVWNVQVARMSKQHDNANVLVIPSDYVSLEQATSMIHTWLDTAFLGDRYAKRIAMIDTLCNS